MDAAGGEKIKTAVECAAASVRVELSRKRKLRPGTWELKNNFIVILPTIVWQNSHLTLCWVALFWYLTNRNCIYDSADYHNTNPIPPRSIEPFAQWVWRLRLPIAALDERV